MTSTIQSHELRSNTTVPVAVDLWTFALSFTFLHVSFVVGLLANPMVLLTLFRTTILRSNAVNGLVANLCLADMVNVLGNIPLKATLLTRAISDLKIHKTTCLIRTFIDTFSTSAQLLTLVAIGYERYDAIANPFKPMSRCRRRVRCIVCVIWGCSVLLAVTSIITCKGGGTYPSCPDPQNHCTFYYIGIPLGIVSIISVTVCYGGLTWLLHKHLKVLQNDRRSSSLQLNPSPKTRITATEQLCRTLQTMSLPGQSDVFPVVDRHGLVEVRKREHQRQYGPICLIEPRTRERGKRKLEARVAWRVLLVIAVSMAAWLPLPTVVIFNDIKATSHPDAEIIAVSVSSVTVILNPLMYALIIRQFRTALKALLVRFVRRRRKPEKCFVVP